MSAFEKPLLFLLIMLLFFNSTRAQQIVKGQVTTTGNSPLSLVSVVLLEDSTFRTATTTNENGSFALSFPFQKNKGYTLQLSLVGYQSLTRTFDFPDTAFLHHLVLPDDPKTLQAVKVTAKKPLVTRGVDRYTINVENSFLADGSSALDALQKSPGVWVDNRGNIRLKGTQPVMVMINEVVQQLSGEELADYLRSLRAEDINRIEVIPSPPAEFEAAGSGGIIHIILKKGKKDGWNAALNAQYRQQGSKPYATTGATGGYQLKKLNLAASYSLTKEERYIFEKAAIAYGGTGYSNVTDRFENIGRYQYRIGLVYDPAANQSVSVQTAYAQNRLHQFFTTGEITSTGSHGTANAVKHRNFTAGSTTFNYVWRPDTTGTTFRLIADYTNTTKSETNDFDRVSPAATQHSLSRNNAPVATEIYTVQADYTKPVNPTAIFRAGVKYASIKRDNSLATEEYTNNNWMLNSFKTNRFLYTEKGIMAYTSLEASIKKTSIKAGLRAEQTLSNGNAISSNRQFVKNYFGLFPSLFLLQNLNEKKGTSVSVSYTRRLTRPSLSDLNPARLEFNSYTALIGNPDLLPQYTHNISLSYRFLKTYTLETYLAKTVNYIALSAGRGVDNFIEYTSENVGSTLEYGFAFSQATTILPGWAVSNNAAFYHSGYYYNGLLYRQTSFYAKSVHTLALKHIGDIDAVADYRSAYVYTNLHTAGNFSLDVGFTRKLFKDKSRLRLAFEDVFNTLREKELTEEQDTRIEFYRKRPTRTVAIYFTCNFSGGKKFSTKKIDQSNGEERGRTGN